MAPPEQVKLRAHASSNSIYAPWPDPALSCLSSRAFSAREIRAAADPASLWRCRLQEAASGCDGKGVGGAGVFVRMDGRVCGGSCSNADVDTGTGEGAPSPIIASRAQQLCAVRNAVFNFLLRQRRESRLADGTIVALVPSTPERYSAGGYAAHHCRCESESESERVRE